MFYNIGDYVSFHSLSEDFEWVNDIERFIDDTTVYLIHEIIDEDTIGVLNDSGRLVQVSLGDYQIHTKDTLRNFLVSRNHKHAAICNKVRQLYRKHNESNSSFKFQGV